ncbi:MBL fold metallo-hydrolase [Halopseudomonas salegens]|uniref:L-ascorbate metabolism protein UlaG, beta-lactamase superfamily n=1 Tax=Halopseudomonas salegens TaxID=1434072 RepID=A0A1H2E7Y3_9GAMM|nr:MBL fold metallo-hydrolase [Halopseudomonas salegens]SDT91134.1 L-ascorbate metabolism protein UlaG, beta-lactamase superfamily [Halopseudomonas salegens]
MKITQLRNATILVAVGDYRILVDPMLAAKGSIPPLKYATRTRRRNPLVSMPVNSESILSTATHALITHCQKGHFDHLDRAGTKWLRERKTPVFCMPEDADFLQKKGLVVQPLTTTRQGFLSGQVTPIPCQHGTGLVGTLMAHGHGYYLQFPGEPSLYLAGDTILTSHIKDFIAEQQPDICVLPAGGARFDLGDEVIMGVNDVQAVAAISNGLIVANHLEALDHCPVTREQLMALQQNQAIGERLLVPDDGETLVL